MQTITKISKYILLSVALFLSSFSIAVAIGQDMDKDGVEDSQDLCPFYWQASQVFMQVVGCQDADLDGFEDMFWDECPGIFGRTRGCDVDGTYSLIAANDMPQVRVADACFATAHSIQDGDILLLEVEGQTTLKNAKPLYSYPIRVE